MEKHFAYSYFQCITTGRPESSFFLGETLRQLITGKCWSCQDLRHTLAELFDFAEEETEVQKGEGTSVQVIMHEEDFLGAGSWASQAGPAYP